MAKAKKKEEVENKKEETNIEIADVDSRYVYSYEKQKAIQKVVKEGIMEIEEKNFFPKRLVTKEELALALSKILEKING